MWVWSLRRGFFEEGSRPFPAFLPEFENATFDFASSEHTTHRGLLKADHIPVGSRDVRSVGDALEDQSGSYRLANHGRGIDPRRVEFGDEFLAYEVDARMPWISLDPNPGSKDRAQCRPRGEQLDALQFMPV